MELCREVLRTSVDQKTERFDEVRELMQLREHPSWKVLNTLIQGKLDHHVKQLANLLLNRTDVQITQREIDYLSGWRDALVWFKGQPDRKQAALENALRREGDDLINE